MPGVVVIQEWWGLEPQMKDVTDRFAAEGLVALAPILYHAKIGTELDEARHLAMELEGEQAVAELVAAARFPFPATMSLAPPSTWSTSTRVARFPYSPPTRVPSSGLPPSLPGRNPNSIEQVRSLHCPLLGRSGEADLDISPSEVERLRRFLEAAATQFEL
ncbi:dienelactone hydrolase family protein [Thermomicrobium sp. CFH 73360]|uniref:dienelactone hydrolase family protein n=1 Tax=Thermomicrobium sp. CFH 73360 TaxID=2951987 RepID=UPI0020778292|nr:dienelactone hydrolase family protein [Thermomicrobium sp. CFH 73360]MCM8746833.1 dienelactone hydrolase family protein [Thermomicrobium sp. CFH 73360]